MITEDELANSLIRKARQKDNIDISTEVHYNYYGDRGIVDLQTINWNMGSMSLYELKSENAVKEATGANEIIRQFNRMQEYFFKDHTLPKNIWELRYELCFTPSKHNFTHIMENADMYSTISSPSVSYHIDVSSDVFMRDPLADSKQPIVFFLDGSDYREMNTKHRLADRVSVTHPHIYEQHKDIIEQMSEQTV